MTLITSFVVLLMVFLAAARPRTREEVHIFHLIDNALWGEIDGTGLQGSKVFVIFPTISLFPSIHSHPVPLLSSDMHD